MKSTRFNDKRVWESGSEGAVAFEGGAGFDGGCVRSRGERVGDYGTRKVEGSGVDIDGIDFVLSGSSESPGFGSAFIEEVNVFEVTGLGSGAGKVDGVGFVCRGSCVGVLRAEDGGGASKEELGVGIEVDGEFAFVVRIDVDCGSITAVDYGGIVDDVGIGCAAEEVAEDADTFSFSFNKSAVGISEGEVGVGAEEICLDGGARGVSCSTGGFDSGVGAGVD